MWVIDNRCSRHKKGKKDNFNKLNDINGGYVGFGDNAKGQVIGVGIITISLFCDLVEVYLVDGLKHNLLSISQLCDVASQILFDALKCTIRNLAKNITIIGDRVENIYVLNNVDLPTLTCITTISNDPWLWNRKLGHAIMHAIEKFSKLDLVLGLPKLNYSKDHVCNACQFGK